MLAQDAGRAAVLEVAGDAEAPEADVEVLVAALLRDIRSRQAAQIAEEQAKAAEVGAKEKPKTATEVVVKAPQKPLFSFGAKVGRGVQ